MKTRNILVSRRDLQKLIDYCYEDEAQSALNEAGQNVEEVPESWDDHPEQIPAKAIRGHIFLTIRRLDKTLHLFGGRS